MNLILIFITQLLLVGSASSNRSTLVYKWTVGIPGGPNQANLVAKEIGCKNIGLVRGFDDVYLFERRSEIGGSENIETQTKENNNWSQIHSTKRDLELHPLVLWVDPQTPQKRFKRDLLTSLSQYPRFILAPWEQSIKSQSGDILAAQHRIPLSINQHLTKHQHQHQSGSSSISTGASGNDLDTFNDDLWKNQWYLHDSSNVAVYQSDIELKVEDVWRMGFTGKGVVVTILDDGLEWNHTDIYPNYDALASWDMNNNRSDPFPRYDSYDTNSHGTRCAGEVAMVANNRKCGVGVAPKARIGGIKCLDGDIADHIESMSLLHNIDYIDIYSGSWGPKDDGQVVDGPKRLATQAFERGTRFGRQGKGSLYVWASGNGGALGDNCNCDGYVNSIYTISVGGVTQQGSLPFYGERCSSTLAVTCSSGAYQDRKIVTTDLHNKCTIDYTGTSAAAPLAAGIYALALEANSNLTWRDAQHLTVWTSNPIPIRENPGWKRNAAGFLFNNRFGFGLLNAKAMVEAALSWQTVPKKSICIVSSMTRLPMFLHSRNLIQAVFVSDGCQREYENNQQKQAALVANQQIHPKGRPIMGGHGTLHQQQSQPTPVIYLEHVQVIIDLEYTSRGSLDIFLVSPSGTISTLLSRRPLDVSRSGFDKWPLMSVHFWGETSHGKWTLIVRDKDSNNNRGLLRNATLILHGTTARPAHQLQRRQYDGGDPLIQNFLDPVSELDESDIYDLNTFPNEMSLARDDSFQPTFIKSIIAIEQMNRIREEEKATKN